MEWISLRSTAIFRSQSGSLFSLLYDRWKALCRVRQHPGRFDALPLGWTGVSTTSEAQRPQRARIVHCSNGTAVLPRSSQLHRGRTVCPEDRLELPGLSLGEGSI